MSLEALPGSVAPSQPTGDLEIVRHLLSEALRALPAANQSVDTPTEPAAKPKRSDPAVVHLKPSRPAQAKVDPELRARAEALRLKAMLEPCGPIPPLTPEELAVPAAGGFDPAAAGPDDTLPLPARIAFEELVLALRALSETERAAALAYISTELPKRTAG
jgi:hypothetical protein